MKWCEENEKQKISYNSFTCWICDIPSRRILNEILNVPADYYPIALIRLGYPKNGVKKIVYPKFPLRDITYYDFFDNKKDKKITKKVFNPNTASYRLKRIKWDFKKRLKCSLFKG